MSSNVNQKFGFPIRLLKGYSRRFQAAMADEIVGPAVTSKLAPTFPTDLDAQIEIVAKFGSDQVRAKGAMNELTQNQQMAQNDVAYRAGLLRDAAKAAFAGNDPLLHSEFFVGVLEPRDQETMIDRWGHLVESAKARAEALAAEGWTADDTKALEDAIEAFTGAKDHQDDKSDEKSGITAQQIAYANRLYRMCRIIQRVARSVYSRSAAQKDPSVWAARARFLLDEFPPKRGEPLPEDPASPPPSGSAPTGGTPTATSPGS